ncbi:MAG: hypothetical protein IPJ98_09470 [Bryobacterales bacterium]|nr:hypothetical protein [Bryobacterales bacterium]
MAVEVELDPAANTPPRTAPRSSRNASAAPGQTPPDDAELFVMCYLEGFSYDELAAHMNVERGTIGSRLTASARCSRKDLQRVKEKGRDRPTI